MSETNLDTIRFGIRDLVMIISFVIATVTQILTTGAQVREVSQRLEQTQREQDRMYGSFRELNDLRFRTLELRIEKLEQQLATTKK